MIIYPVNGSAGASNHPSVGRIQIIVNAADLNPSGYHVAGIVKVVIIAVNLLPGRGHGAVGRIHIIFVRAVAKPSRQHFSNGHSGSGIIFHIKIIVIAIVLLPPGKHFPVCAKQIVIAVNLPGAVQYAFAAGRVEIIPSVVHIPPSLGHSAIPAHVVIVGTDVQPLALHHGAVA